MMQIKERLRLQPETGVTMRHTFPAMFYRRQSLRSWTVRVLLVWLLGLGFGTVQACLATSRLVASVGIAAHPSAAAASYNTQAGIVGSKLTTVPACEHGELGDTSPGRSNCADFCDQATTSMPSLKWPHDALQAAVLFTPIVPFAAMHALPVEAALLRAGHGTRMQAPPISIVLLRLTL